MQSRIIKKVDFFFKENIFYFKIRLNNFLGHLKNCIDFHTTELI